MVNASSTNALGFQPALSPCTNAVRLRSKRVSGRNKKQYRGYAMRFMSKRGIASLTVAAALAVAACGSRDDTKSADGETAAVEGAGDASVADLGADASTADAMSVDVAAGGVEPMTDPATVDAVPAPEVPAE